MHFFFYKYVIVGFVPVPTKLFLSTENVVGVGIGRWDCPVPPPTPKNVYKYGSQYWDQKAIG